MALSLAGLPEAVPAATINRLCGSGLDAVNLAARAIRTEEAQVTLAGGVESMTRAPFVRSLTMNRGHVGCAITRARSVSLASGRSLKHRQIVARLPR